MVFVSENEKTGTFSHLWMSTAIHVCFMVFVSENLNNRNFLTFMSVFMVFVSENGKTGVLSHLWMSTAIYVHVLCLFVVSENEKTGTLSHLRMSTAIYVCFMIHCQ